MRIVHHVSSRLDAVQLRALLDLGIEPELSLGNLAQFKIEEANPAWPQVSELIQKWDAGNFVLTDFSRRECTSAAHLDMGPNWHCGYPQPEDTYQILTYERVCSGCGIVEGQRVPFRMAGEPNWRNKHILQLNWVFDEFFVRPETWEAVFKPFGIECLPVLAHASGRALKTVVQIKTPSDARAQLNLAPGLSAEVCQTCQRRKYEPLTRGRFPSLARPLELPIAKSEAYFGSGFSAWQANIISHDLFRAIDEHKLKGARFTPLEELA